MTCKQHTASNFRGFIVHYKLLIDTKKSIRMQLLDYFLYKNL